MWCSGSAGFRSLPPMAHQVELRLNGQPLSCAFDRRKQGVLGSFVFRGWNSFQRHHTRQRAHFLDGISGRAGGRLGCGRECVSLCPKPRWGECPVRDDNQPLAGRHVCPTILQDAILYVITSETAEDTNLEVRDKLSGGRLTLRLPAQHAALALISKSGGTAKAKYGF